MRVCVIGEPDSEDPGLAMVEPALAAAASPTDKLEVVWISPATLSEEGVLDHLGDADAIFGPPGPTDAPDGYVDAIEFAREGQLPYFGCELGMDLAIVEFARRVLTLPGAHSIEFDDTPRDTVVVELTPPELVRGRPAEIFGDLVVKYVKDARMRGWIGADTSREVHRARYTISQKHKNPVARAGFKFAATDETQLVVRALELTGHPFFVVTSFAPHLRAPDLGPHPILKAFVDAAGGRL